MVIKKIESRDNLSLKLARKVRDGKASEFMFVEGTRLAEEAVRSGIEIDFCIVQSGFDREVRNAELMHAVRKGTNEILTVGKTLFASISDTATPQGIVLVCTRPNTDRAVFEQAAAARSDSLPLVLMLSEINNPSNLGAVVRAANAAGAAGLIVGEGSSDVFSPKALRGSMGSAFSLPIWTSVSNSEALKWAGSRGFSTVGTSGNSGEVYTRIDWRTPHLLIMGSEAHGIDPDLAEKLDRTVKIPLQNNVESLNLAVAAGVILFEARRQFTPGK